MLSNTWYDRLKFIVQIGLPALGTFYFALAGIWGLPAAEQVVGTVVALTTFLGVLLGLSTRDYNKGVADAGELVVEETLTGKKYRLELNEDPDALVGMREARFGVVNRYEE